MGELISLFQTAFVPGRKGVVQELIHTIGRKKGKVGYMAIKIDLEKAYDKLEWSFIRDILGKANIPNNLIQIIMSCVSIITTSMQFNRGCLKEFCPIKGYQTRGYPIPLFIYPLYGLSQVANLGKV